ncbi:MAG: FliI/YscN family ATPase [Chloroflexi bacterium]|nr:FliI/YscN family ATPase [Chloroflexota bacterium]
MLADVGTLRCQGAVAQVVGLTIEAEGLAARLGEMCTIHPVGRAEPIATEVVGFRSGRSLMMPLGDMQGVQPGSPVVASGRSFPVPVGEALLGRVLDGLGRPLDRHGPLRGVRYTTAQTKSPHPLLRTRVQQPLVTGVRAIDALLTCGKGQRMGIFSGSGVGKSTILGMIARNALSDVNVIALIGERGREVRDFLERDLGDGLSRSVVVVSTSDQPALVRLRGAWVATTIAEYFRDHGYDVTLLMDSVTRFAMAQREVGLAVGEPPATKGYTPSVFALLPRLLERAGTSEHGTITAFYSVLVDADDFNEPISDAVRGVLDGHVVLARELAVEGHYPAIDVLHSLSRVMPEVTSREHRQAANKVRELLATYQNARDLINIGAYVGGSNPQIDEAIARRPALLAMLRQEPEEATPLAETLGRLGEAVGMAIPAHGQNASGG